MFNFKILYFILISLFINFSIQSSKNDDEATKFIPTKDWQVVKPGQSIPAGLHVRSNFQTGVTEAKILDENENDNNTGITLSETVKESKSENSTVSPEKLKNMLKNIKNEIKDSENITKDKNNQTKFRTYEELQKEFDALNMYVKTDSEIIKELLDEYKDPTLIDSRKLTILQDLEYYLHQIDNCQNFVEMGGLTILQNNLDDLNENVGSQALLCMASCFQGNPKVKVKAIQSGLLIKILRFIKKSNSVSIKTKIVLTISALTRQFPLAQTAFINGGGLDFFGQFFDSSLMTNETSILVKIMTLISDWLRERKSLFDEEKEDSKDRFQQYSKLNLEDMIQKDGWCGRLEQMVLLKPKTNRIDYDEKVATALIVAEKTCRDNVKYSNIEQFAKDAIDHITQLKLTSRDGDDDDHFYFDDIISLFNDVKNSYKSTDKHNEL